MRGGCAQLMHLATPPGEERTPDLEIGNDLTHKAPGWGELYIEFTL